MFSVYSHVTSSKRNDLLNESKCKNEENANTQQVDTTVENGIWNGYCVHKQNASKWINSNMIKSDDGMGKKIYPNEEKKPENSNMI